MGAKQSKKSGETKISWAIKSDTHSDGVSLMWSDSYAEASLERSNAEHKKRNLIGLPEDVIGIIAVFVARNDIRGMGAVARVCKTWRRISYKDAVWRAIAQDRSMIVREGTQESLRVQVLHHLELSIGEEFVWLPEWARRIIGSEYHYERMEEFRVCVVSGLPQGPGGVGKSALCVKFIQNVFLQEYDPTIEDSYRKQIQPGILVDILDTAGQEEFSAMRDQYLRTSQAFIFCDRFEDSSGIIAIQTLWEQLLRVKDEDDPDKLPVVIIVRTKSDLMNGFACRKEVMDFCREKQLPFYCCSAKTGANVERIFTDVCVQTKARREREIIRRKPRRYD